MRWVEKLDIEMEAALEALGELFEYAEAGERAFNELRRRRYIAPDGTVVSPLLEKYADHCGRGDGDLFEADPLPVLD